VKRCRIRETQPISQVWLNQPQSFPYHWHCHFFVGAHGFTLIRLEPSLKRIVQFYLLGRVNSRGRKPAFTTESKTPTAIPVSERSSATISTSDSGLNLALSARALSKSTRLISLPSR
jgi:hypothetical protein